MAKLSTTIANLKKSILSLSDPSKSKGLKQTKDMIKKKLKK